MATEPRGWWPCGLRDLKWAVNPTKVVLFFKEKKRRNLHICRPLLRTWSENIVTFQNISTLHRLVEPKNWLNPLVDD
jgi:hypothetical protein